MSLESSPLPAPLDAMHRWAHAQPWLGRFTLMNRLLLAMAFIPTGLVKATNQRFTVLPVENPIGFFFEAMYQTGPWWIFIGCVQVAAGVLLLIPATSTIGAILFLPIGVSIFLITWGVGFGNTVLVAGGMVLAVTYLVCWDADRIWAAASKVVGRRSGPPLLEGAHPVEKTGWALGGATGIALWLGTRGYVPSAWFLELLAVGVGAALMVVIGWILGAMRSRRRAPVAAP